MIGLFNIIKFKRGKFSSTNMIAPLMYILTYIHTCISWLICKFLVLFFFPFCMALFLILNLLPFKFFFPVLDDFSIFHTTIHMYIQVSLKFAFIIITHNMGVFLSNLKMYTADWSLFMLLKLLTMLAYLRFLYCHFRRDTP